MLFSKDTLKSFAASKGIENIEEESYRILSQDLEYRIKEVCQEAAKFMHASHRKKLNTSDVNNALISRNVEPLFGYESQEILIFKGLPSNSYFVPDEEIDLEEYLDKPLPKIPLRPYIQSHWLAIEGVQPPIQQNPIILERQQPKNDPISNFQEEMIIKKQIKHRLTKELNMYFEKILQVMETDPSISMECLENETGIQQLVPYFIHQFNTDIRNNIGNTLKAKTICLMYFSLLKNKFLFIDPYLHEILPSLLSCVVGKSVSHDVRDVAIDVIKYVYDNFSCNYLTLAPRIVNTLKSAWLNEEKIPESRLAAIKCLSVLSSKIVENFLTSELETIQSDDVRQKSYDIIKSVLNKN
ncbi:transcription initiation factor TFIID subunit [Enterocytozoon bieneusi H348]|nr:transcription initiation factor TFIID subunit [Enterocytozoon bieneusi H348]|eukprot:XP_002649596.1 transcription initiation factor TFIID subunit [Enterocytozoon bieneusi H348]